MLFVAVTSGALTVVVAVDELFAAFVSPPELLIVAMFEITVAEATAGSTVTTMVIVPLAPGATVAAVQVTVPFAPTAGVVQLKPGAVTEANVVEAGSASVIVTAFAWLGPDALHAIE
jgi:hypothetical protein